MKQKPDKVKRYQEILWKKRNNETNQNSILTFF